MLRLRNRPDTDEGIREAARLGYNIVNGIKKATPNHHTKRPDPEARAICRRLRARAAVK